jgi:hypothetical protein
MSTVTLPSVDIRNKKKIHDTIGIKETLGEFDEKIKKVTDLKIYLKQNFHRSDIDDAFLKNLDIQYATILLETVGIAATKYNIEKLLKVKPIEKCDFYLTVDNVRDKSLKLLHIFPNAKNAESKNLKQVLTTKELEKAISNKLQSREQKDDKLLTNGEIKLDDLHQFIHDFIPPNKIAQLITRDKEIVADKKVTMNYHDSEQSHKEFDLSIESIRKKYINPFAQNLVNLHEEVKSGQAKFQNMDKIYKHEIVSNEKFEYPFLDINLNKEILKEVNRPVDVPIDIIKLDINYILDNFPIEQLINIEELPEQANKKSSFFQNNGLDILRNVEKIFAKSNDFYKIKSISKKDIQYVYKKLKTEAVYKVISLLVRLIYWIVFAFINRFQIEKFEKQKILFEILSEVFIIEKEFGDKKMFDKFYMPIMIIIIRIEVEAIFHKKFKNMFSDKDSREKALEKINELITTIFDPNAYFTTFTLLSMDVAKLKHKMNHNLYPKYKNKINATSNFLNQIFTSFTNQKNVINMYKGKDIKPQKKTEADKKESKFLL